MEYEEEEEEGVGEEGRARPTHKRKRDAFEDRHEHAQSDDVVSMEDGGSEAQTPWPNKRQKTEDSED